MARFSYQPMFRMRRTPINSDSAIVADMATPFTINPFSHVRPVSIKLRRSKAMRLNETIAEYESFTGSMENTTNDLDTRIRDLEKKRNDLTSGVGLLPPDLPPAFYQAVNSALESLRNSIFEESKKILDASEAEKMNVSNNIFQIKKEHERIDNSIKRYYLLKHFPVIHSYAVKKHTFFTSKIEQLNCIIERLNTYYDRLTYCRNLAECLNKCYCETK